MSDQQKQKRKNARLPIGSLEVVTVYRDRNNIPYDDLTSRATDLDSIYSFYNVVGVIRDVSEHGVGLSIQGQDIMSAKLLKPGERFVLRLKFKLPPEDSSDESWPEFLKRDDFEYVLLLKAECRWHGERGPQRGAGFRLVDENPPDVITFVKERFHTG